MEASGISDRFLQGVCNVKLVFFRMEFNLPVRQSSDDSAPATVFSVLFTKCLRLQMKMFIIFEHFCTFNSALLMHLCLWCRKILKSN